MLGGQEAAARPLLRGLPRVAHFFSSLETALGGAAARLALRLRPEIGRRAAGREVAGGLRRCHAPRRAARLMIRLLP